MEKHYIYLTKNIVNGKSYVGKHTYRGKDSFDKNYLGSGYLLKRAIKKYGKDNFIQEILEYTSSKEENAEREVFWIKELNTLVPNGYNIDKGGTGGGVYLSSENSKFIQLYTWENYTEEERNERIEKMKNGLKNPEVLKVISEKSKQWHSSLNDAEKAELIEKQKAGWTDEARHSHKEMMSNYNKSFKMKDKLILKYGEELGIKKYDEWKQKISSSVKSNASLQENAKKTVALQKQTPTWSLYQKRKAEALHLRSLLRKGKISNDEFEDLYNKLKLELKDLNKRVKMEVKEIERNDG
ncbi:MAG: GIY-YIG nuclease family protein [Bacteroidales bacterium]|nr:GIY-YIG nuclease family protein [Bacteroidales bacterium]